MKHCIVELAKSSGGQYRIPWHHPSLHTVCTLQQLAMVRSRQECPEVVDRWAPAHVRYSPVSHLGRTVSDTCASTYWLCYYLELASSSPNMPARKALCSI